MIRCTQCGYKNSPVYHYCGVCGAVLQAAKEEAPAKPAIVTSAPASAPVATEPSVARSAPPPPVVSAPAPVPPQSERGDLPVSGGMSFLGLSDSPSSSSPSYLLDDEDEGERSVAWGRILFVLILLGAAGGLGWQYYIHGYPFGPRTQSQTAATPAAPTAPAPAPTDSSAAPATPAPATPTPSAETPAPDASKPAEPAASTPAESTPPAAAKTETAPAETKPAAPDTAEKSEAVPEKTAPVAKAEKVAPARPKTPPPAPEPAVSPGDALYVQGQRYLYGNGVAPNCDLALKSLLSSASRANSKAQSTLGAMYSTGHCVTRDLPTAYRWFAKALHQDPNNTRLEQDLSVVWKQMTPGERQSATKAE